MLVDIVIAALAFYFSIPLVAGYFAHSYGRSFWLWFTISTFLPIITHFILFFLVYSDERIMAKKRLTKREKVASKKLIEKLMKDAKVTSIGEDGKGKKAQSSQLDQTFPLN